MPELIKDWNDFRMYGINFLTGEGCNLSLRGSFDLTPQGCALLEEFLNIAIPRGTARNLHEPEAGYIMLPYGIFGELAAFCLLHDPKVEIALIVFSEHRGTFAIGCAEEAEAREFSNRYHRRVRWVRGNPAHPRRGYNNVHSMWGFSG
jgi:hypothetical protein